MQLVGMHLLAILLCNLISLKHEDHEVRLLHRDIRGEAKYYKAHMLLQSLTFTPLKEC
jgi:hypothetical protein